MPCMGGGMLRLHIAVGAYHDHRHIRSEDCAWEQVQESPDAYREVTLPFIEAIPASRTQWVHNILAGTVISLSLGCFLHGADV